MKGYHLRGRNSNKVKSKMLLGISRINNISKTNTMVNSSNNTMTIITITRIPTPTDTTSSNNKINITRLTKLDTNSRLLTWGNPISSSSSKRAIIKTTITTITITIMAT